MTEFKFATKGNASPQGKPRVYFTCHPEDFDKYFDEICEDIFKNSNCVIYYTENLIDEIEDEYKETDLGQVNLFVIPITLKLLTEPNRAMDSDYAYANQNCIPVLPIMMEPGLDVIYSAPDKFGERQYLNPFSTDITAIGYEEKLRKYLESVLVSDETAKRVRAAFDAYIFLSYRKKDRQYANELMKLIHNKPEFRDIAVWYDEFLTPGESFKENIDRMLKDSKLFTLLVTPNLLEDKNFVMEEEFPKARDSRMNIIPAEMEKTDREILSDKYRGIPECVDPYDEEFKERFAAALSQIAISENSANHEHNFLIGLAYLEGIDVEVNRDRGLELLIKAGEAELPEAMEKLYEIYSEGKYVSFDYKIAVYWAEKAYFHYKNSLGEEAPETLTALNNLAHIYGQSGDYKEAAKLQETAYKLSCKVFGDNHSESLLAMNNLSVVYAKLGNGPKALEYQEKACELRCKTSGEDHSDTILALGNLASIYCILGKYEKAVELQERVCDHNVKVFGEEHRDTLLSLCNLASSYFENGNFKKALELQERVYKLYCKVLGESHPETLNTLSNLAITYGQMGDSPKEAELEESVYNLRCKVLGEEHPSTLNSLNNLAVTNGDLGNVKMALELKNKVYNLRCKVLGEEHPDTVISLNNLASEYKNSGDLNKALSLQEKTYNLQCKVLGESHPDTLTSYINTAVIYVDLKKYGKAEPIFEKGYNARCEVLGKNHPITLMTLMSLGYCRYYKGDISKATETLAEVYRKRGRFLRKYEDLTAFLESLALNYLLLKKYQEAKNVLEELYNIVCDKKGPKDSYALHVKKKLNDVCKKSNSPFDQ